MLRHLAKQVSKASTRSSLKKTDELKSAIGSMALLSRRKYATEEKKADDKSQEVSVSKQPMSGEVSSARPESDVDLWALDNTDRWWMSEFNRMKRQMDNMFGMFDPFSRGRSLMDRFDPFQEMERNMKTMQAQMKFNPTIDVAETEKEISVHAELPGLKKEDVKISLHDGVLEIKGEKKTEKKEGDEKKMVRLERRYGSFLRRIPVPRDADPGQVKAKFENGVLEVHLAKPETKKPNDINIE
jgi:HSP20 family protein